MKKLLIIPTLLTTMACAAVDGATGTTFQERCAFYATALAGVRAAPRTDARDKRIAIYEALLETCLDKPAEPDKQ